MKVRFLLASALLAFMFLTSCKQKHVKTISTEEMSNSLMDSKISDYEVTTEGTKLTMSADLLFSSSSYVLTEQAKNELDKIASLLKKQDQAKIRIDGYADATGTKELNLTLSENRANAVKIYLEQQGISSFRIVTKGYGQENPVGNNRTPEGRKQNRRVEITILN